jgi:hypothetical protein
MPILILAELALQGFCIFHCVRTGRTNPWIYVLMVPGVGPAAYFAMEILPEWANSRRARRVFTDVNTVIDPDGEFRRRKAEVELTGTPAAKAALADECSRKGMLDEAIALYRSALTGFYADDPHLLLGFARVLLEANQCAECERTLDHLREKNPDFQSQDGHLIYARALDGQDKVQDAMREYEAVSGYFAGLEAKTRYGLFLKRVGNAGRAHAVLEDVVKSFKAQPRHAQELNRDWYDVARKTLLES